MRRLNCFKQVRRCAAFEHEKHKLTKTYNRGQSAEILRAEVLWDRHDPRALDEFRSRPENIASPACAGPAPNLSDQPRSVNGSRKTHGISSQPHRTRFRKGIGDRWAKFQHPIDFDERGPRHRRRPNPYEIGCFLGHVELVIGPFSTDLHSRIHAAISVSLRA